MKTVNHSYVFLDTCSLTLVSFIVSSWMRFVGGYLVFKPTQVSLPCYNENQRDITVSLIEFELLVWGKEIHEKCHVGGWSCSSHSSRWKCQLLLYDIIIIFLFLMIIIKIIMIISICDHVTKTTQKRIS